MNTCKFCLKLYELFHSEFLCLCCCVSSSCFRVTLIAVQAPLKHFSQCTSSSLLFLLVSFPGAVPEGQRVGVPELWGRKTWGLV